MNNNISKGSFLFVLL